MDIKSLQKPLKEQYRRNPASSRITLTAKGSETATPLSCSVDIGRAIYQAEAHKGVGGTGTAACSGDLLLGTRHAGLLLFDGNQLPPFSPALTHIDVTALAGNETGICVGTRDRGLGVRCCAPLTTSEANMVGK